MKLKESTITIEVPAGDDHDIRTIRLSGVLSEWLFASKFWAQINMRCGTIFDQYEEDEACEDVVGVIFAELAKRIQDLTGKVGEIEFVHGWDASGVPLTARINSLDLIHQIEEFRDFLEIALKFHVGAYMSL